MDIAAFLSAQSLAVLGEVMVIDLALAGDNAVVVGSLAAGLPREQQKRVILVGTVAALVLRVGFALVATWLLHFVGVLAVAGTARDHPAVLFIGLALSVTLMGLAANIVARLIERFRWIIYVGLAVILYVAGKMIYEGIIDPQVGVGRLFGWV